MFIDGDSAPQVKGLSDDDRMKSGDEVSTYVEGWRAFEDFLLQVTPAVGGVNMGVHENFRKFVTPDGRFGILANRDGCISAFHRETVTLLLPYIDELDAQSWWYSQYMLKIVTNNFYYTHAVTAQYIDTVNRFHEQYPKGTNWSSPEGWFREQLSPFGYDRFCKPSSVPWDVKPKLYKECYYFPVHTWAKFFKAESSFLQTRQAYWSRPSMLKYMRWIESESSCSAEADTSISECYDAYGVEGTTIPHD